MQTNKLGHCPGARIHFNKKLPLPTVWRMNESRKNLARGYDYSPDGDDGALSRSVVGGGGAIRRKDLKLYNWWAIVL